MRIIVTGGKGQLGRSLHNELKNYPHIISTFVDVDDLNLCDLEATKKHFENNQYDILINCAAYTNVEKAETDSEVAKLINATAVENLASIANSAGFKIIHISTDYVFDGSNDTPYRETDPTNPCSIYGETKLRGEKALMQNCNDAIIIRTAWLYSPYGKNFFLTMRRLALSNTPVRVVSDQTGTPTYAPDLAFAIMQIIKSAKWEPGLYHFTNDGITSWDEFAREIYRLVGSDPELVRSVTSEEYHSIAKRPKYSVLDKSKIIQTFGLNIPYWKESLEKAETLIENGNK